MIAYVPFSHKPIKIEILNLKHFLIASVSTLRKWDSFISSGCINIIFDIHISNKNLKILTLSIFLILFLVFFLKGMIIKTLIYAKHHKVRKIDISERGFVKFVL